MSKDAGVREMNQDQDAPNTLLVDLWPDAGQMLGLTRTATYAAAARGEIKTIGFGRRKKVSRAWL